MWTYISTLANHYTCSVQDTLGFTVTECGIQTIFKTTAIRTSGPQATSQLKSLISGYPSKSQLNLIRNNFNPHSLFSTEIKILKLQGIMYIINCSRIKQNQIVCYSAWQIFKLLSCNSITFLKAANGSNSTQFN